MCIFFFNIEVVNQQYLMKELNYGGFGSLLFGGLQNFQFQGKAGKKVTIAECIFRSWLDENLVIFQYTNF